MIVCVSLFIAPLPTFIFHLRNISQILAAHIKKHTVPKKSKGLVNNTKFELLVMIQKISCSLQKLTIICLLHHFILRLCIMFHKVVIVSSNLIFKHPNFFFFIYLTRKTLIQRL